MLFLFLEHTSAEMTRNHFSLLRTVLSDNKEMITRPAITIIPSIFSLLSVPLLIASFMLGCINLENSSLRHMLITFYFGSFVPQTLTFFSMFIHHHYIGMNGIQRESEIGWLHVGHNIHRTLLLSSLLKEKTNKSPILTYQAIKHVWFVSYFLIVSWHCYYLDNNSRKPKTSLILS